VRDNRKIRVLECIRQGQVGGGESHLLSLIENLDRSKFEPIVLSFTDGPMVDRMRKANVECHVIHTERPFDISKRKVINKFIRSKNVDIIHAHGTRANSNVMWSARSLNIPVVYTVHGWSFHPDQNFIVRNLRVWGEKYLTSKSDINISVSASNKKSGEDFLKKFESVIINNGIDQNKFSPEKELKNIRKELGISSDAILVLFVARFTHQKQPLQLLAAFAKALKQLPQLHLLMVGDGELKTEAVTLAGTLNINPNVTFTSFRSDIPEILAAGDIFMLPSLWEGLPIGLLEAMAMGKAIIASDVDGTSELIIHNKNGILIQPGNREAICEALLRVAKDPGLRLILQQNSQITIRERYNAVTMTRQIEEVYLKLFPQNKFNQMEFERITDIKRLKFISNVLESGLPEGAEVLDVGCGNGVISRSLGKQGFKVKGVDISEKAIARAMELNNNSNVSFEVKSAEQLVSDGARYHAVICSEVLEHLNDPGKLLAVLHDVLHKDGVLIVTVPNGQGPRELLVTRPVISLQKSNGPIWKIINKIKQGLGYRGTTVQSSADDLTHIQFFTKSSLIKLAQQNNFSIIKFGKTNFVEDVFPFSLLTKKIKVLQKLDCAIAERLPYSFNGGFVTVWEKAV